MDSKIKETSQKESLSFSTSPPPSMTPAQTSTNPLPSPIDTNNSKPLRMDSTEEESQRSARVCHNQC